MIRLSKHIARCKWSRHEQGDAPKKIFNFGLDFQTTSDAPLGLSTVHLKSGQFIFGRNKAAEELCMKNSTLKNYINFLSGRDRYSHRFENRELDYAPKGSYSIISVRKWKKYQVLGQPWDTNNNISPNRGYKKKKLTYVSNQIFRDLERDKQIQKEWKEKQR